MVCFSTAIASGSLGDGNWVTGNDGSWFDAGNWVEGEVPITVDQVNFGVNDNDFTVDEVDIDNNGLGVDLPASLMQLERKMIFSDSSGNDDVMNFERMRINGAGGSGVVFNVPVIADTMTSNRHGGIFNEVITANNILAMSEHQDRWQINASATAPVNYLLLDENRGPDGENTNGSFNINSDLEIVTLDHVWGRLRISSGSIVNVERYNYFDYTNQADNNSINPININGVLVVDVLSSYDTANDTVTLLEVGTYGSVDNLTANFQVDFISGDGLLVVRSGEFIYKDGFDTVICNFESEVQAANRGCR